MEDIQPVVAAFKPPLEEYLLRGQAFEHERFESAVNMVKAVVDTFLPDPEACDEEALASCLIESDSGIDLAKYNFNADIFSTECAATSSC